MSTRRRGRKRKPSGTKDKEKDDNTKAAEDDDTKRINAPIQRHLESIIVLASNVYGVGVQYELRVLRESRKSYSTWACHICGGQTETPTVFIVCAQPSSMCGLAPYRWREGCPSTRHLYYEWLCDACGDEMENGVKRWMEEHQPYNAEATRWLLVAINIVPTIDLANIIISYLSP